jgi:hypothetical protein
MLVEDPLAIKGVPIPVSATRHDTSTLKAVP